MADTTFVPGTVVASTWLNDVNTGIYKASSGIPGTVSRTLIDKLADTINVKDYGVISDITTDQTTAINTVTAYLSAQGYKGTIVIPQNTKYNPTLVMSNCPLNIGLKMLDNINWGQYPTYINKFDINYFGDIVSNDSQTITASGHHPAIMLLNMGTAGSVSANNRYASILQGVGKDAAGDPMVGWMYQFAKDPSNPKWRVSYRVQTPYSVAIFNPQTWIVATTYAANAYCLSDGGKVYKTTLGGISGGVAPTGTGSGINDGGVLWDYVQAALNIDRTAFDLDEDGNTGQYGPTTVRHTQTANSRKHYHEINGTTNDVLWRDSSRGLDIWRVSTTGGLQTGMIQSPSMTSNTITSSGILTTTSPLHVLTSVGGPWDITDLTLPAGQTSGEITLWFTNTNINLKNNANIVTGTGADITSAANKIVVLLKAPTISGSWIVKSKNF